MPEFGEPTLMELLARERSPQMRRVIERYRNAQLELLAASKLLEDMSRFKWALAVAQRATEIVHQCRRNLQIDRDRVLKIHDFMGEDERPTNPLGYPRVTGLAEQLEPDYTINQHGADAPEVISNDEAVFDTDRAPPFSRMRRHELLAHWALNIAIAIAIGVMLYIVSRTQR